MKCSKSRSHLTDEDRFLIEKSWNIPDGRRHPSVRAIAKSLGLAEATLRRELKRGCADGEYCMELNDKGKRRWQYFLYSAEAAILDARWQASAKGPRIKLTTSHISTIRKYLKEWPSIPSAYADMVKKNPNESFPSLRTFQYHAQKRNWSARVNGRDLYNPYGRRPKHAPTRTAGNHNPTHRIDDLPEEVRKYRVKGYAQMDTIHSGARGKGGLLTMILPADDHKAFVRRLKDLRQETVHRALRRIARECRRLGIKITHILTDNGSEFLDEKTIGRIFGATVYYTHAYAGWEKGAVENLNRIIRHLSPPHQNQKGSLKCGYSRPSQKSCVILLAFLTAAPRGCTAGMRGERKGQGARRGGGGDKKGPGVPGHGREGERGIRGRQSRARPRCRRPRRP